MDYYRNLAKHPSNETLKFKKPSLLARIWVSRQKPENIEKTTALIRKTRKKAVIKVNWLVG